MASNSAVTLGPQVMTLSHLKSDHYGWTKINIKAILNKSFVGTS